MARQTARKLFVTVFALSLLWGAGVVALGVIDGPLRPLVRPRMVEPSWSQVARPVNAPFDPDVYLGKKRAELVRERVSWFDASELLLFAVAPAALLLGGRAWWRWVRAD